MSVILLGSLRGLAEDAKVYLSENKQIVLIARDEFEPPVGFEEADASVEKYPWRLFEYAATIHEIEVYVRRPAQYILVDQDHVHTGLSERELMKLLPEFSLFYSSNDRLVSVLRTDTADIEVYTIPL